MSSPLLDAAMKVGEPPSDEGDERTGRPVSNAEPRTGSYESFMSTFGPRMAAN